MSSDNQIKTFSPLLRIEQVAELLGCSSRHVSNLYREGRMPPRIVISERLFGWRESDLEAWLQAHREEQKND
jgi:excisionase family DNA binding protein